MGNFLEHCINVNMNNAVITDQDFTRLCCYTKVCYGNYNPPLTNFIVYCTNVPKIMKIG